MRGCFIESDDPMRTRLLLVAVSLMLASCSVIDWFKTFAPYKMEIRQGNYVTPEMKEKLRLGMSREQVSSVLGSPLVSDVYHANRWDYIYRLEVKGKLAEQSRLTVYFKDGFVSRIEQGNAASAADLATLPAPVVPASAPVAASAPAATAK